MGGDRKERPGFVLEFEDEFDGDELDRSKWYPYMLPHWTTASASVARYRLGDGHITMFIDEEQEVWLPGDNRVSNIQTGHFSRSPTKACTAAGGAAIVMLRANAYRLGITRPTTRRAAIRPRAMYTKIMGVLLGGETGECRRDVGAGERAESRA